MKALVLATFTGHTSATVEASAAVIQPPPNFQAVCEEMTTVAIRLDWDPTPTIGADGYRLFRSITTGGPYQEIATMVGRDTTTYRDEDVELMTTYHYVIRATAVEWSSADTPEASADAVMGCVPQ